MSGFGAPARTETPSPASTNGVPVPGTTLPFLTRSSNCSGLAVSRSPGAGELSLRSSAAPASWITVTLCPLACENAVASSRTPGVAPWLVRMTRSAAAAPCGSEPNNMPAAAIPARNLTDNLMGVLPSGSLRPRRSRSASLGRLHMAFLQQRDRLRRDHELDQLARQILLLGDAHQADIEWARLVGEARQRADIVGARNADQHIGLLDAKLEVALGQIFGDRPTAGEFDLGLHLLADAELVDAFLGVRAAAAAREPD